MPRYSEYLGAYLPTCRSSSALVAAPVASCLEDDLHVLKSCARTIPVALFGDCEGAECGHTLRPKKAFQLYVLILSKRSLKICSSRCLSPIEAATGRSGGYTTSRDCIILPLTSLADECIRSRAPERSKHLPGASRKMEADCFSARARGREMRVKAVTAPSSELNKSVGDNLLKPRVNRTPNMPSASRAFVAFSWQNGRWATYSLRTQEVRKECPIGQPSVLSRVQLLPEASKSSALACETPRAYLWPKKLKAHRQGSPSCSTADRQIEWHAAAGPATTQPPQK